LCTKKRGVVAYGAMIIVSYEAKSLVYPVGIAEILLKKFAHVGKDEKQEEQLNFF